MKWLLLALLVLLAGCSTASPRSMRRQADTLDQQADALRQDAAELERAQEQARVEATAQWIAHLTASAPTQTPTPTETPTPLPTLTEPPTWTPAPPTATATSTPEPSSTPQVEATPTMGATAAVTKNEGRPFPTWGIVALIVLILVTVLIWIPRLARRLK